MSIQAIHQTTLRELLGRSPDRADSLALAALALRQPSAVWDRPLICSGEDGDSGPFTAEEILELPADLRELIKETNAWATERRLIFDQWDDHDM